MIATTSAVARDAVLDALRGVFDPELDESIVELGFVEDVRVADDAVEVVLRLPTFWCAPNFSYLMAYDAREAAQRAVGARRVRITLRDNAYSDEISAGISDGLAFVQVFPGQADGDDLDELRRLFARKGFGMRQEQLTRFLLDNGLTAEQVVGLRASDVLDASDASGLRLCVDGRPRLLRGGAPLARMYLDRRRRLELAEHTTLLCDDRGLPIPADELESYLEKGRKQRISITFNTLMCRGLLETRYGLERKDCL